MQTYTLSNIMDTRTYPVLSPPSPSALADALLSLPLPARYALSRPCAEALAEAAVRRGEGAYGEFWEILKVQA